MFLERHGNVLLPVSNIRYSAWEGPDSWLWVIDPAGRVCGRAHRVPGTRHGVKIWAEEFSLALVQTMSVGRMRSCRRIDLHRKDSVDPMLKQIRLGMTASILYTSRRFGRDGLLLARNPFCWAGVTLQRGDAVGDGFVFPAVQRRDGFEW